MGYDYSSTENDKFSLHDCRATSVELTSSQLIFRFPDGFYFEDYSDDWPNTGKAAVIFEISDGVIFYLFEEKEGCEIREQYTMEQVAEKINNREWELEFAYRYDGYQELLYTGWIWQHRQPWSRECQMFIGTKENVIYNWDRPNAERK